MPDKCQLQIEAYEIGETDQLEQETFDLDKDGIMEALMFMRELSAKEEGVITHFDIQIICDGSYYDGGSLPPFKRDYVMQRLGD